MADDATNSARAHDRPGPNPALERLNVMVGTWDLKDRESGPAGEISGRVAFEWMGGGFYLVQRVDIGHAGQKITGAKYVGCDWSSGAVKWRFFSNHGPRRFVRSLSRAHLRESQALNHCDCEAGKPVEDGRAEGSEAREGISPHNGEAGRTAT